MNAPKPYGKQVLAYFVLFFGTIIIVNAVFIYIAVKSHTGVITENPYEKGLRYDQTISQAKAQQKMKDKVTFENGTLRWTLKDKDNSLVKDAYVTAKIIRPVQDGYDINITLNYNETGYYEAALNLPLKGLWQAHMKAQWNNTQYQTTENFQVR
tara:strand:+ start:20670 stop:21131 length:462 start_codon:yes stop_codon:yes gene_type:complete